MKMISRFGFRPAGAAIGAVRLSVVALPLAFGVGVMAPAQAMPSPAPSPTPGQPVKFYVVAPASPDGQQEFLFEIAQKTLGNGNRFGEIFNLTKGRLQPDGQRLTDPTRIEPGWVLVLPDDASGPGVRQGRIPGPAARPPKRAGTDLVVPLVGAGAAGVALLAGTGAYVRRRRRRGAEPVAPAVSAVVGGTAPHEAGTGPWLTAREDASTITRPDLIVRRDLIGAYSGAQAAPGAQAMPVTATWDVPPEPPAAEPVQNVAPAIVIRDVPPAAGASVTDPVPLVRDRDVHPRPAGPAVLHEVSFGDDLVAVRVTAAAATAWRPLPHDAPGGRAVVCVGAAPQGCLFVDLGTAPGAVSIAGPAEAAERLAEAFVSQLATDTAGVSVALVGDVLEAIDGGPSVRRVPDLGALSAASTPSNLVIAFVPAGYDAAGNGLLGGSFGGQRVVQVRLGDAEDATWSLTVVPDRAPRAWQGGDDRG